MFGTLLLAIHADSTAKAVLKEVYRFHDKKPPVHKYYNSFRISVSILNVFTFRYAFPAKKCIHILINIFFLSLCETEEKGAEEKKNKEKEDEVKDGQNEAEKAPSADVQVVSLVVHARMR